MSRRLKSVVWQYFNENPVMKSRATCTWCDKNVPRGGEKTANFTTTNLWHHREHMHKPEYDELKSKKTLSGEEEKRRNRYS